MDKITKQTQGLQLAIINHHTAGIDVGSMLMMVAYTDSAGKQCLLETDGFTQSIEHLALILKKEGVTNVAMEATGVYWMSLYEVLEASAIQVTLINPRHFKNVDAQKTDVKDCQWIQQLHAHGLLRASHIAPEEYRELKSYLHERNVLQTQKSDTLNRIHRILTLMNVKVQHLISDIEGVSGMRVIRAISDGVVDTEQLLGLMDLGRLKAPKEELLKSLQGVFKRQYVVILKQLLKAYDFFKSEMNSYEYLIEEVLKVMLPEDNQGKKTNIKPKGRSTRKNQYSINVKGYLEKILQVDATEIIGLDEISVLEIISVTGIDMNKWKTADHFTSWLNLSPRPKKTGGKIIGHQKRFTNNKATQAFRLAAQTIWKNKGPLGNLYRRLSAQKGSKKAIKAVARKIAVIFYAVVKNQQPYDKNRLEQNQQKQNRIKLARLQKEAAKYGYNLSPVCV